MDILFVAVILLPKFSLRLPIANKFSLIKELVVGLIKIVTVLSTMYIYFNFLCLLIE